MRHASGLFVVVVLGSLSPVAAAAAPLTAASARALAERHVADAAHGPARGAWDEASEIVAARPLFRTDVDGIAYWEFKVAQDGADSGFVIVSTAAHDFPIPHWRTSGKTPSEVVEETRGRALDTKERVYRSDALRYETAQPSRIGTEEAEQADQRARYFASLRVQARDAWSDLARVEAAGPERDDGWVTFTTPGPSPTYGQFDPGHGPNASACLSGCGATAWAILFGWADIQATSNPTWANAWGIYRAGGGRADDVVAPEAMDGGVEAMTWEIRTAIGTWCSSGQGATGPWNMGAAQSYLNGRAPARVDVYYNAFGMSERRLADHVIDSIANRRTPAVIGTGWLKHYPVATAYAYKDEGGSSAEWFYVNQGWSGSGNDWVAPSTWFSGSLLP